jgi:hypothetical protein
VGAEKKQKAWSSSIAKAIPPQMNPHASLQIRPHRQASMVRTVHCGGGRCLSTPQQSSLRQQSTWQIRERVDGARRTPGMAHWCEKRHRLFNVMMLRTHRPCLTSCREEGSFAPKSAVLRCSIFLLPSTLTNSTCLTGVVTWLLLHQSYLYPLCKT